MPEGPHAAARPRRAILALVLLAGAVGIGCAAALYGVSHPQHLPALQLASRALVAFGLALVAIGTCRQRGRKA